MKQTLPFSEEYVWMSYRYCIGRHTIAAHHHAETIAQDVYGKISDERMQFNSEEICSYIYDQLHFKCFIYFGWFGNIPKTHFKPIDAVYSIFNKESINTEEKVRKIKSITIDWNREKNRLPRAGERVLVMRQIENEVFPDIATYIRRNNYHNGGNHIFYLDDSFDTESVTHWQEIVLPKKEKE